MLQLSSTPLAADNQIAAGVRGGVVNIVLIF